MADEAERRETVVIEKNHEDRSSSLGWLIALIILVLLAMVFIFGLSPFSGGNREGSDINVETPSVNSP